MIRQRRRGISRLELGIGLLVLGVLFVVGFPLFGQVERHMQRAELAMIVDAVKKAELDRFQATGHFVAAEASPRSPDSVDEELVPWAGFGEWYTPEMTEVRGSYRVRLTATGFEIVGVCDIDGDGRQAVYTASELRHATRITAADVY